MSETQQKFDALLRLVTKPFSPGDLGNQKLDEQIEFILSQFTKITNSWEVVATDITGTKIQYDSAVVEAIEAHLFSKYPNEKLVYRPYLGGLYAQLMSEKLRQITYTLDGIVELFKAEDETARKRLFDTVLIVSGHGKLSMVYVTTSNMMIIHENAIERVAALCNELFNTKKLSIVAGLDGTLPRVTFDPIVENNNVSIEETPSENVQLEASELFHPHQKLFTAVLFDHANQLSRASKLQMFEALLGNYPVNKQTVLQNGPMTTRAGNTVVHKEDALQILINFLAAQLKIAIQTNVARTPAELYDQCTRLVTYGYSTSGQITRSGATIGIDEGGVFAAPAESTAPSSPERVANNYREDAAREIFRGTVAINELAGNPSRSGNAAGKHQLYKIVKPELEELEDGFVENDLHEIIDGVGDVIFTTIGLGGRYGFDVFEVMRRVVASQFTKFDRTVEQAAKTRQKYLDLGVKTYVIKNTFEGVEYLITKVAEDATGSDGKKYPADKWLKSFAFVEPTYDDMIAEILAREDRQAPAVNSYAGEGAKLFLTDEGVLVDEAPKYGVSPEGLKQLAADLGTKIKRLSDLPEDAIQLAGSPKWEAVLNKLVEILSVEITEADLELFLSLTEGDGVDPDKLVAQLEGHEMAYLKHMDITVPELMFEASRMESDVDSETLEMARLAVKASFGPIITKLFGEGSLHTSILGTDVIPTDHKILFAIRVEDDVVVAISFKPAGL